jgi:glycosyltransferase involved in cell wall biosynthesis
MSHEIKICIISEFAYSLLTEKGDRFGGAELQMTLLANELIKKSYDVSFITFEKSSKSIEKVNNIKIYNPFSSRGRGYTFLRPIYVFKLLKLLNNINADIYIQKGKTPLTGILAFFSKLKNKAFLYISSSEKHVNENLKIRSIKEIENLIYSFGVRNCNQIICQTNNQKRLLKQNIGKEGKVIKNLFLPPKIKHKSNNTSILKVLWIGRIVAEKKAELYLQLAKSIPEFKFLMIGGPSASNPKYYNKIKNEAKKIDNLEFLGFIPHNKINKYYEESSVLVNTSPKEGFPNIFLEAWGNKIPVITLEFDPDGIISEYKLGFHSENFQSLINNTYKLLNDKNIRERMGNNAREYIEKEHDTNKIINQYEKTFREIISINNKNYSL